jgi:hypothetical protein
MKGQTGLTLVAAVLLALGVGAGSVSIYNAAQEASNPPPQPANIVDDDDDDDGSKSVEPEGPSTTLIDGFEDQDMDEYYNATRMESRYSFVQSPVSQGDYAFTMNATGSYPVVDGLYSYTSTRDAQNETLNYYVKSDDKYKIDVYVEEGVTQFFAVTGHSSNSTGYSMGAGVNYDFGTTGGAVGVNKYTDGTGAGTNFTSLELPREEWLTLTVDVNNSEGNMVATLSDASGSKLNERRLNYQDFGNNMRLYAFSFGGNVYLDNWRIIN